MFHIAFGWMTEFILAFKVFLGQKLYEMSDFCNLDQKNIHFPP